jgi:electron transfer flavoprotein beta subunit
MGAARAVHVADDAIKGSDMRATLDVLAAALRRCSRGTWFAGRTSDGQGGAGRGAGRRLGLPYLSYAAEMNRLMAGKSTDSPTGYDILEAPTPAVVMGTQLLGAPRYPSLRGIMQARTKPVEAWSLADLDRVRAAGGSVPPRTLDSAKPPSAPARRSCASAR